MIDTVKLHYAELGQGMPIVLIHGFPLAHTIWNAQAEALSDSYRVITPDLRGHGQSPAPEGVYHMDLLAREIAALLDDLGIEQAVWVAQSMGGYVAMAALRLFPERFRGIGLVATHPHADSDEKRADRMAAANSALANGSQAVADAMLPILFAPEFDLESETAVTLSRLMARTAPQGIAGAQRGMAARPDSVATLQATTIPALVIAGAQDQIVDPDVSQRMAATMPNAMFVPIEHAGHMPMLEQPDATTDALRAFMTTLTSS
ncbi:MAG: alpha/beta fold hydrolase [Chloroflexi bacterium]|nr:alpha/beta fold hydrolase [Chloroflexota bacterium]